MTNFHIWAVVALIRNLGSVTSLQEPGISVGLFPTVISQSHRFCFPKVVKRVIFKEHIICETGIPYLGEQFRIHGLQPK